MISAHTPRPWVPALRVAGAAVLVLLVAGALDAQERSTPPQALSLQEAIATARENNPSFLQQRNDIAVARSSVRSAYGELLPQLSASTGLGYTAAGEARFGSVGFGAQPASYSSDYSVGMNLSLSGASLLEPSVQRSQRRATERRVTGVGAQLDAQVAQQYLTILQARERAAQAEREVARTREHVRLAEAQLEVGAGTPLDVRRAEVTRGQAEVALIQERNAAEIAALTLGQLIGVPLDPSVDLTTRFEIFAPTWEAGSLVQGALENNPTLLAARASNEAARTGVKSARTSYLPSLNMRVGLNGNRYQAANVNSLVQQDLFGMQNQFESCQVNNELLGLLGRPGSDCGRFNPADPTVVSRVREARESQNRGWPFDYNRQPVSASVSLSLPIFQGFSRQLRVDQARAAAADAQHTVRAEELRLRQEISAAVRNLRAAYATAQLQEQVRANAAEEFRLATERFRFGAANSIEVTDAQTRLANAEKDQIDAVYVFHKSLAALEALVGRSLR